MNQISKLPQESQLAILNTYGPNSITLSC